MRMMRWATLGLLLLATPGYALAQDKSEGPEKAAAEKPIAARSEFDQIVEQFDAFGKETQPAMAKLVSEIRAAKTEDEQQAAYEKYSAAQVAAMEKAAEFGKSVRTLLEADPTGEQAFDMISWLIQNASTDEALVTFAKDTLVQHHLSNERVKELIPRLASSPSLATLEFLDQLSKSNAQDEVKATAALSRIDLLMRYREQAKMILEQQGDSLDKGIAGFFKASAEMDMDEVEKTYKEISDQYGEVKFQKGTVAKFVASKLKNIETQKNLQIGKIAPEIEGLDLNGVSFKLSDYRGKVVMLDFWGHW